MADAPLDTISHEEFVYICTPKAEEDELMTLDTDARDTTIPKSANLYGSNNQPQIWCNIHQVNHIYAYPSALGDVVTPVHTCPMISTPKCTCGSCKSYEEMGVTAERLINMGDKPIESLVITPSMAMVMASQAMCACGGIAETPRDFPMALPTMSDESVSSRVASPDSVFPKPTYQVPYLVEEDKKFWVYRADGRYAIHTVKEIFETFIEKGKPGHWANTCTGEPYFACDQWDKILNKAMKTEEALAKKHIEFQFS